MKEYLSNDNGTHIHLFDTFTPPLSNLSTNYNALSSARLNDDSRSKGSSLYSL